MLKKAADSSVVHILPSQPQQLLISHPREQPKNPTFPVFKPKHSQLKQPCLPPKPLPPATPRTTPTSAAPDRTKSPSRRTKHQLKTPSTLQQQIPISSWVSSISPRTSVLLLSHIFPLKYVTDPSPSQPVTTPKPSTPTTSSTADALAVPSPVGHIPSRATRRVCLRTTGRRRQGRCLRRAKAPWEVYLIGGGRRCTTTGVEFGGNVCRPENWDKGYDNKA
jgi:hypothetical protein